MRNVPYSSLVAGLMHAIICTRPDLAHALSLVSRFMVNPGKEHWICVKWIIRYARGSTEKDLCYGRATE